MKISGVAALALCAALRLAAADEGLVTHITFDDATRFGYDNVQETEIGTIVNTSIMGVEPAGPTSCAAPVVRGLQVVDGFWKNNYLSVPGASFGSAQGIPFGNQAVTYSLWIRPSAVWQTSSDIGTGTQCCLLRHAAAGHEWYNNYDHRCLWICRDGTTGFPRISFAVGNGTTAAASATWQMDGPFDGDWHFVAATYEKRVLTLYYDGQRVARTTLTADVSVPDNSPLSVGAAANADFNDFVQHRYFGGLDDLKVYSRALDEDEILSAYHLVGTTKLEDFPKLEGETDDTGRLQRAIDATRGGVLNVPKGTYRISSTLTIANGCALAMHKNAVLMAIKPMDYVLRVRNDAWTTMDFRDYISGGTIDARGLAGCLSLDGYWAMRIENVKLFNPKTCGLHVSSNGAELLVNGVYVLTRIHGLAGNTGLFLEGGDSHYTDIFVLDCTTGVRVKGSANRLTRVHCWGGSLPVLTPGELPEMLVDSTSFLIEGSGTILRDCYADTGKVGFDVRDAWEVRLMGCTYFNNAGYGLDDLVIVRQTGNTGSLLVSDCVFTRSSAKEKIKVYDGTGGVLWRDTLYAGDWSGVERP